MLSQNVIHTVMCSLLSKLQIFIQHFSSIKYINRNQSSPPITTETYIPMSESIEQTLRKSREVQQKFKAFMARKPQSDKSLADTLQKIKETQNTIKQTKTTISKIDNLYKSFQQKFDDAIKLALDSVQKSMILSAPDPNWVEKRIDSKQFVQQLKKSQKVMFLTGAGMSVASGIPTFRGANGFWNKEKAVSKEGDPNSNHQSGEDNMEETIESPQEILTMNRFKQSEWPTWEWLLDFYHLKQKTKPNKGHTALHSILKEIVASKKQAILVTQNIEEFHRQVKEEKLEQQRNKKKSNSENSSLFNDYQICEIHGSINKLRCEPCSQLKKQPQFYQMSDYWKSISHEKKSPLCPKCSQPLRPHIMFFDEFYTEMFHHSQTIRNYCLSSSSPQTHQKQNESKESEQKDQFKQTDMDLLVVIGTALETGLSRQIVENALEKKVAIIEINTECQIRRPGVGWMVGKADEVLEKLKMEVWKTGLE